MITGLLNLFTESDLDQLHAAVLKILEDVGMRVESPSLLQTCARAGIRVDMARHRAYFSAGMVEEFIAERRKTAWLPPRLSSELEKEEKVGLSGVIAPFYYDYEQKVRRSPTREDLVKIIQWAEVDLSPERLVGLAVTMSEVDPRVEPIEAYAILLEHSRRPDTAYTLLPEQVTYLVELAEVYYGKLVYPRGTDFITSPLTFSDRMAGHVEAVAKYGQKLFHVGVMPISGSNAPYTLAGTVAQAAAEGLGGALIIRALVPDATFSIHACNGVTDLRRGVALFNAPEALLTDLGLAELVNRRYGGGGGVAAHSDYIDAALPGMQAAYERASRGMAIAAFTGERFILGGQGTLCAGQIFSPEQLILERELSAGLWRLGKGIQVNEETLGMGTIKGVVAGEYDFLDSEHTLKHCREMWMPKMMYRGPYRGDEDEQSSDRQMLDAAHKHYKDAIARYTLPEIGDDKLKEMQKIVAKARKQLMV